MLLSAVLPAYALRAMATMQKGSARGLLRRITRAVAGSFGTGPGGAATTRDRARELVRCAEQVFVAYGHDDLSHARALRARLIGLRPGCPRDSVFLDQESLQPSRPIEPDVVDQRLESADLVVVVCGQNTCRGTEVLREVRRALERSRAGGCSVLPIILQPGVRLPEGIDFRVQGIFLNHLFPRIGRVRQLVTGSIVVLMIAAGYLAWDVGQQTRARRHAEIDLALREDERSRHPTNTTRRGTLELLAERARAVGYRVEEIVALRDAASVPEVRRELLPPRQDRQCVVVSGDGRSVVIGHAASIELRAWCGELGASSEIDLRQITQVSHGGVRNPAKLVSLAPHPSSVDVLVEVEYEGFAVPPEGDARDEATHGGERELFRLSIAARRMTSLGLTRTLEWKIGHDLDGDENGPSWWELSETPGGNSRAATHVVPAEFRRRAIPERSPSGQQRVEFELLAADPLGSACLIQRHNYFDPAGRMFQLGAGLRDITTVATDGDRLWELTPTTAYYPEAPYLSFYDGPATYTSDLPQRLPAALHWPSRRAQLRDLFVEFDGDAVRTSRLAIAEFGDWSAVTDVTFDGDGERLIVRRGAQDVSLVDPHAARIVHRLVLPPESRSAAVVGETGEVLVVRRDGALDAWDATRFGPEGWLAAAGPEIAAETPPGAPRPPQPRPKDEAREAELPRLEPIGTRSEAVVPRRAGPAVSRVLGLVAALTDPMIEVRVAALDELRRHVDEEGEDSGAGPDAVHSVDDALTGLLASLEALLQDGVSARETDLAIALIRKLGRRAEALTPQVVRALRRTSDADRRVALLEVLAHLGGAGPEVVAAAGAALTTVPREGVRHALAILKTAGPAALDQLGAIHRLLELEEGSFEVFETWLAIDPDDPSLCGRLLSDLADGRFAAPILEALPKVRPHHPADLAPLRLMLFAESEDDRRLAMEAVQRLGNEAREFWSDVAAGLGDEDESVRAAARDALRDLAVGGEALPSIVFRFTDAPYPDCLESLELLHALGLLEARHVARLGDLLHGARDPDEVGILLHVLGRFGAAAAPVAPEVARRLADGEHREGALRCLAAIGRAAQAQLPEVLALSENVEWGWADAFIEASWRLGQPLDEIVEAIRPLARRDDAGLVVSWLQSEAATGGDLDELLIAILQDGEVEVRALALAVLDERHIRLLPRIAEGLEDAEIEKASVALEAVARIAVRARRDGAEIPSGAMESRRLMRFLDPEGGFGVRARGIAIAMLLEGEGVQAIESPAALLEIITSGDTEEVWVRQCLRAVLKLRPELPPETKDRLLRIAFDDDYGNDTRTLALRTLLATGAMPRLDDERLRAFAHDAERRWHHPWFVLFEHDRGVAMYLPKVVHWLGGEDASLREVAVSTFRQVGEDGGFLVAEILGVMEDPVAVRAGLEALGCMPESSASRLAEILERSRGATESYEFRSFVEELAGLAIGGVLQIAEAVERAGASVVDLRLACYTAGGGRPEVARLMEHVARPLGAPRAVGTREQALTELEVLHEGYAHSRGLFHTELHLERALAEALRRGARAGFWRPEDLPRLEAAVEVLHDRGSLFEPAVRAALSTGDRGGSGRKRGR